MRIFESMVGNFSGENLKISRAGKRLDWKLKIPLALALLTASSTFLSACTVTDTSLAASAILVPDAAQNTGHLLLFTKTAGWRHSSIPSGIELVKLIGREDGLGVVHTEDSDIFSDDGLSEFDAIIFLNTSDDILDPVQQAAMERFIRAGGGFVGVHAAADTEDGEFSWPWYNELLGAEFHNHQSGKFHIQEASVRRVHEVPVQFADIPQIWQTSDEWYNFTNLSDEIQVIAYLERDSIVGSEHYPCHPVVWVKEYDGGRSFYVAMGHLNESFAAPEMKLLLRAGINYVMQRPIRADSHE